MTLSQMAFVARNTGLWLGMVCIGTVLGEAGAPALYWVGPLLHCIVSPWLGRWLAGRSSDPRKVERGHLLISHVLGGMWAALMGFNVLPTVVILSMLAVHSMTAAGTRGVLKGLVAHALGMGLGVLVYGWWWQPVTSLVVMWSCLPAILLQPLAMSHVANRIIRKLQTQREQLRLMASRDALSGLANRSHWEEQVRREFARARRHDTSAALVMIDLDHFKSINDRYGHAAGDTVIRGFGALIRACLRESDLGGRYGGEEFGLLLTNSTGAAGLRVVERVRRALADAELYPGVRVTASYGIVELAAHMHSPDAWMAEADDRLYAAKRAGRDCIQATSVPITPSPPDEAAVG